MLKRRVMLVEDHPVFRRALKRILEESGRCQIVAEAESGHAAIQMADMHRPDMIILDVQLPGVTGLKIARVLRKQHPRAKIIFLSMHMDDERLFEAIRVGASAFLTKDVEVNVLVDTVRQVGQGENLINPLVLSRPQLARKVLTEFRSINRADASNEPSSALSSREIEVLDCVALGYSNKQIADQLFVTEQTVKNHMTSVLKKLDVNDRVQAVLYAVKNGWMEIGPRAHSPADVAKSA
jgi:DNA-binding NarL/FixJ family response regulator